MELANKILSDITVHGKYARHLDSENRRETWSEVVTRNMNMHIKKFPHMEQEIRQAYQFIFEKKILPSMRSLQFAGKAVEVNPARIFNCFGRETTFVTSYGVKSFLEYENGDEITVLTHKGNWKSATVRNYGQQKLYELEFHRGRSVFKVKATKNHRWILRDGTETTSIKVGDKVMAAPSIFDGFDYDNASPEERLYWAYGYIFGDGTLIKNKNGVPTHSMVRLCGGEKGKYSHRFKELGFSSSSPLSINGDEMVYSGTYLKTYPDASIDSPELIRAFVRGYLDADDAKVKDPSMKSKFYSIVATGKEHQYVVEKLFPIAGVSIFLEKDISNQETNFGKRGDSKFYSISTNTNNSTNMSFTLHSMTELGSEDVWCLEVEDDNSFVLPFGISTGNCSFMPMDSVESFSELMFLLLTGCGVGYSVQTHHIKKLPTITKPTRSRRFLIADSIEGWSDAVKALMSAYMLGKSLPVFDYSDIRPKGAKLKTSGGKAPGPEPLRASLNKINDILSRKENGQRLSSLEINDINCIIADAVLAGGIRRSAMIALFDVDDEEMITSKSPIYLPPVNDEITRDEKTGLYNFYVEYRGERKNVVLTESDYRDYLQTKSLPFYYVAPQRQFANNSAVIIRHKITKDVFDALWTKIEDSGAGEPGLFFTNDKDWGLNPCAEISLRPYQFCNLVTLNSNEITTQEEFDKCAQAASFVATLQASYTDFHYLRDIWKETTDKEALIGVSMTGIASGTVTNLDMSRAAEIVKQENARVAKLIGIKPAARTTCVKPEGTSSLVLGTSSGIHAWHNDYYIRRLRLAKTESLYYYLKSVIPELIEDEIFNPSVTAVVSIPQKAPENAVLRNEHPIQLLERVSKVWEEWIVPGHRKGSNYNNVSTTINIEPDQWKEIGEWMWKNRDRYTALSCFPKDSGKYQQVPFEDITKEKYEEMVKLLKDINMENVIEIDDMTDLSAELACAGGACVVTTI